MSIETTLLLDHPSSPWQVLDSDLVMVDVSGDYEGDEKYGVARSMNSQPIPKEPQSACLNGPSKITTETLKSGARSSPGEAQPESYKPEKLKKSSTATSSRRRTKTGCLTCRQRRVKCDEGKPTCRNCDKSRRVCAGYQPTSHRVQAIHPHYNSWPGAISLRPIPMSYIVTEDNVAEPLGYFCTTNYNATPYMHSSLSITGDWGYPVEPFTHELREGWTRSVVAQPCSLEASLHQPSLYSTFPSSPTSSSVELQQRYRVVQHTKPNSNTSIIDRYPANRTRLAEESQTMIRSHDLMSSRIESMTPDVLDWSKSALPLSPQSGTEILNNVPIAKKPQMRHSPAQGTQRTSPEKVSSPLSCPSEGECSYIGRSSDEDNDYSTDSLDGNKRQLARNLVTIMLILHNHCRSAMPLTKSCASTQDAAPQPDQGCTSQSKTTSRGSTGQKRPRHSGNHYGCSDGCEDEDNEGAEDPGNNVNINGNELDSYESTRTYACPYNKVEPIKYSHRNTRVKDYRVCSTVLLRDISTVKQHLYRVHKRPTFCCPTCFSIFDSGDFRDAHVRARQCDPCADPYADKMPEKVYLAIKRKKREPKGLDQPGKEAYRSKIWHEIFQAIFPGRRCPESPYMNNQECVLHLYNIFVTLGPVAQFVYNSLLVSQTGIPLPEMTRDVVHEAYTVFLEEFGETYLAGTAGTTSSPLYHDQIPEVSITPFTSRPLIWSDSDYSTQSSSSQPLSQDPFQFSQFTDNEPLSESVPTYRPNFTHNVPDHANLDFYASQSIASTPDNQSNIAIYTPDLDAITDSLCDEALSTRHDTSSFDIFECVRNRFTGGSMHEVLCSEVAATAPALAA